MNEKPRASSRSEKLDETFDKGTMDRIRTSVAAILKYPETINDYVDVSLGHDARQRRAIIRNQG